MMIYRMTTNHSRKIELTRDILNALAYIGLGMGIILGLVFILLFNHWLKL